MSGTVKTVLIVGAAAAAAFIILRAVAPAPMPAAASRSGGLTLRGIVDIGSAIGGAAKQLFGSESQAAPTQIDGVGTGEFQAGHFGVDYS